MTAASHRTGKGHKDENFPVASLILRADARAPVMAYYAFARTADDVSDSTSLPGEEKLRLLNAMEAALDGGVSPGGEPEAETLRRVLAERGLSDIHARELLIAFRRDVTQLRYADWDDLMDYCRYSAMPVGRFVLDVHGESRETWGPSDALCAALQVINHLQDCAKDKRLLDRVYIPDPQLRAAGLDAEILTAPAAPPALLAIIRDMVRRTDQLLDAAAPLASMVRDTRLACEVAIIQSLARRLTRVLAVRDPLSQKVHLGAAEVLARTGGAIACTLASRLTGGARPASADPSANPSANKGEASR